MIGDPNPNTHEGPGFGMEKLQVSELKVSDFNLAFSPFLDTKRRKAKTFSSLTLPFSTTPDINLADTRALDHFTSSSPETVGQICRPLSSRNKIYSSNSIIPFISLKH